MPEPLTRPGDGYDSALSALRNNVEDLAIRIAIWEGRREPDAHARRCASDAVDAIDGAIKELHQIRQQLISEVQQADRATAARVDALLARTDDAMTSSRDQASPGPSGPGEPKGQSCELWPSEKDKLMHIHIYQPSRHSRPTMSRRRRGRHGVRDTFLVAVLLAFAVLSAVAWLIAHVLILAGVARIIGAAFYGGRLHERRRARPGQVQQQVWPAGPAAASTLPAATMPLANYGQDGELTDERSARRGGGQDPAARRPAIRALSRSGGPDGTRERRARPGGDRVPVAG
jgi:hypothetical protein